MTTRIRIRDVSLRDGLQSISMVMPTAQKLALLDSLVLSGVRSFDVASFVPAKLLPQMADAPEVVKHARRQHPLIEIACLVPNLKGLDLAAEAGAQIMLFPVSASQEHSRRNVRMSVEEAIGVVELAVRQRPLNCQIEVGIAMAFGCPFEGHIPATRVADIALKLKNAGANRIGLADTVGYAHPNAIKRVVSAVRQKIGDCLYSLHIHDTRGLGLSNILAGIDMGITDFDASLGGIGGCPFADGASGNVALEDVVYLLESIGFDTGIDLRELLVVRQQLARALPDTPLHGNVARALIPKTFQYQNQSV